ncbi:MAG: hypothetical protein WB709_13235 [Solirubrobacteraceae bacterium]
MTYQTSRTYKAGTHRRPAPARRLLVSLAAATMLMLIIATGVSADDVLSEFGSGAGQTHTPMGLATDFETGRLYVADEQNNRVDVFNSNGTFAMSFGWGVAKGENELETCTAVSGCRAGDAGEGQGQLSGPDSVAVDNDPTSPSFHDIYVADLGNSRIEKFDPTGKFLLTFGGGVNKTTKGNICTAASGDTCGAGSSGTGQEEFSGRRSDGASDASEGLILIGVGQNGRPYVADSHFIEPGMSPEEARFQQFEPTGAFLATHSLGEGRMGTITVDPTGNLYARLEGNDFRVHKYDAEGELIMSMAGTSAEALTTDAAGDVFLEEGGGSGGTGTNRGHTVEYSPSGTPLRSFAYGAFNRVGDISALAPDPGGTGVYASEAEEGQAAAVRVLHVSFPSPGPVVFPHPCEASHPGNVYVTLRAEVDPEGQPTTVHFQYVDDAHFKSEGGFASPQTKTTPESTSVGSDFAMHEAAGKATVVPSTEYDCRVIATNSDQPAGVDGEEGSFTSLPPVAIGVITASAVSATEATLNATVNPLGIETTGFFEYVTEATYQHDISELGPEHGFDHAHKTPDPGLGKPPVNFGDSEELTPGSTTVNGLTPGTTYRYRVVAADSFFPAGFPSSSETFRTFNAGEQGLPDNRSYELVSPAQKNSAEVAVPGTAGGLFELRVARIQAAASSGASVTYTSWTSFAAAHSAAGTSQYLSKRTPAGWKTENISPFGFESNTLIPPFSGFTFDLGFGAVAVSEPSLTADCPDGVEDLYLRNNTTNTLRCIAPERPASSGSCFVYAGAADDGGRAFFASGSSYVGAPSSDEGLNLYEWSTGTGLKVVSVPPGSTTPVTPSGRTAFGAPVAHGAERCQRDSTNLRHAVSPDGSHAFWTYVPEPTEKEQEPPTRLFVRVNGSETFQLDALPSTQKHEKAGIGPAGNALFQTASTDGTVAYFTDPSRLTATSHASKTSIDLYRYDLGATEPLTDLTKGVAAEVQGVIGASDDGSYVYFVAKGVLSEQENLAGEKAEPGVDNLYVWHDGKTGFIAALAVEDHEDWSAQPKTLTARVTADGRHLAFLSNEARTLADYNNTIASGNHCELQGTAEPHLVGRPLCAEAFVYDAEGGTLTCASCDPSGGRPLGPATVPGWTNPYEGPRYLSDDGSRMFFETYDALTPADKSTQRDVYEFEQAGSGSCTTESPAYDPTSNGCHSLLSSGTSEDESYFVDASADGGDVFISTRSPLLRVDTNENYDVYDVRANGGFPEPAEPTNCLQEATCKAPAVLPTNPFAPASSAFTGAGNLVTPGGPPKHSTPPPPTRAEKLAKALKQCKKNKRKRKRVACERTARKKYGRTK